MLQIMRGPRFSNPHIRSLRRRLWDVILWKTGYYDDEIIHAVPPEDFTYPAKPGDIQKEAPQALWIGHSTYLIQIEGINILTDPVWGDYCSPFPIRGLRRLQSPALPLQSLPPIHLVLISHNHYDHLENKTVLYLNSKYPKIEWVIPQRLSFWFKRRGVSRIKELGWWEKLTGEDYSVTAVPSQHCSGRTLFDQNKTRWNGYVVEVGSKKLHFCGDTGYNDRDFKEIGRAFSRMDLSLIPIGTYVPKKFMEPVHIGPQEAVCIHQDVNSSLSLGMHWSTFRLSDEPSDRPPYDLYLATKEKNLPFETFLPIDAGTYVNF